MGNESDAWESFCGLTEKRHAGSVCWKQQSLRPDWPGRPRPALETTGRFLRGPDLSSCGCSVDCLPALFAAAPAPDGRGLGPGHASESPGGWPRAENQSRIPKPGGEPRFRSSGPLEAPRRGTYPFRKVGRSIAPSRVGLPLLSAPPGTSMGVRFAPNQLRAKAYTHPPWGCLEVMPTDETNNNDDRYYKTK